MCILSISILTVEESTSGLILLSDIGYYQGFVPFLPSEDLFCVRLRWRLSVSIAGNISPGATT